MVSAQILAGLPYALILAFALTGAALAACSGNLLRRVVGAAMIWIGLVLFLVASGVLAGADAPILPPGQGAFGRSFANPLQQSLARAIVVVGAAGLVLALAIAVRIREAYGSIEMDAIEAADRERDDAESKA